MRRAILKSTVIGVGARLASNSFPRILITGGLGQIGSDLSIALRQKYGSHNVIVTDSRKPDASVYEQGPYEYLDVLDKSSLERAVINHNVDWMLHLPAIMSVLGEKKPDLCMDLNIIGSRNALDVCKNNRLRCFIPSSMAVFGSDAGKIMTKDDTICNPRTLYGITKVLVEQLGCYYHRTFGLDFRCIRYPGLISPATLPGGGTTDYAVHMYHAALKKQPFECPLFPDEPLPMMYLEDALVGAVQLLEAPRSTLSRSVYNLAGFSFTPAELHKSIEKVAPLSLSYVKGIQQDIAHSWPDSIDDSNARKDWGWKPRFDLDSMTMAMMEDIPKFHP